MNRTIRVITVLFCIAAGISCRNNNKHEEDTSSVPERTVPAVISWSIVKEHPHDPGAFTEGLQFADGHFYESTGEYGSSSLRETDLVTGKVLRQHKLEPRFFGEGLSVLNNNIYQLTYREHAGFIYDRSSFKQTGSFTTASAEAWGMTTDGTYLIYGDGSNMLYYLDPATQKEVKRLEVMDEHGAVTNINELEFIKGFIYSNQWQTDNILKIDPSTGRVVARADLSTLRAQTGIPQPSDVDGSPEVMNGIAYDAKANRIFITGKFWPKLFEVKLDN